MSAAILVRYGTIPEVSRFAAAGMLLSRGDRVLVQTHRGLQLGTVLNDVSKAAAAQPSGDSSPGPPETLPLVVRRATNEDQQAEQERRQHAHAEFETWQGRIRNWELDLELIDVEWTADRGKLILYVLNNRGPDCTKLALQAAAGGLGMIEVQPVTADGLVTLPDSNSGGGCGTCGCH